MARKLLIENLSVSYGSGFVIKLDSFVANSGKATFIIGPSGCGKSSVLKAIGLLIPAIFDNYWYNGRSYAQDEIELHENALRSRIVSVLQEGGLWRFKTVAENLTTASQSQKWRCADYIISLGLELLLERRPNQLSGGERQRAALARALSVEPDILIIDEPTNNLDVDSRELIHLVLAGFLETGGTAIVATHDHGLVKSVGGDWMCLEAGRCVEQGIIEASTKSNVGESFSSRFFEA